MAFSLPLSAAWVSLGWKVKIRDRERLEPPHVTILHRTRAWRVDLRTGEFMEGEPAPSDVPADLLNEIRSEWATLVRAWDGMYPENLVRSREGRDE